MCCKWFFFSNLFSQMWDTSGKNERSSFISNMHQRLDGIHITYADTDLDSLQANLNHDLGILRVSLSSGKLTLNAT